MPEEEFDDDRTISNEVDLWRRIKPEFLTFDHNLNTYRPSSQAFQNFDKVKNLMSIYFSHECSGPNDVLDGYDDYGLVALTAGLARDCDQKIVRDPTPKEPAHGHVVGRKPKAIQRRFVRECRWIVGPHPPSTV